ncbi:hypothetical protein L2D00_02545 [Hyphomonadaceae bacterium BL14]|nr:hypothetical protein L2D00_02545 [Hyphomonadaceae bacterium BL14]
MHARAWWHDFAIEGAALRVRATGVRVPLSHAVLGDFAQWTPYFLALKVLEQQVVRDGPRIAFAPHVPRPWFLIWPAVRLSGLRPSPSRHEADILFHFEDATHGERPHGWTGPGINLDCTDISKSHVARMFESVFGRTLAIDPQTHAGSYVDKSETNAAHDGQVKTGPAARMPGRCYQRLIDTVAPDGMVEDLRCATVGGQIAAVFVKRRPAARRFENHNAEVRLTTPEAVFSADERARIAAFCTALRLDWGGLDVLRDRTSGEIWIVDANKTDMGPPVSLTLDAKLSATRHIAVHLRRHCETLLEASRAA